MPASLLSHSIGAPPILKAGSDELKARVLPGILAGEKISALAITEPNGGSDVASIRTKARREGDGAVPLRFVRERFPKDVAPIDIGALPAAWPRRGVIAFSGENAPCHVSFLAPDVNDEMQNFLGPLLPVARFLGIPVLDFDKYGLLLDADATAETCVPAATAFLTQYVIKG